MTEKTNANATANDPLFSPQPLADAIASHRDPNGKREPTANGGSHVEGTYQGQKVEGTWDDKGKLQKNANESDPDYAARRDHLFYIGLGPLTEPLPTAPVASNPNSAGNGKAPPVPT